MNKEINYYQILGLNFDFTQEELKKSYRKLSKEHHPDKGGSDDFFKLITESYKILNDFNKRSKYDKESKYGKDYKPLMELLDYEFSNLNIFGKKFDDYLDKFKKEFIHIVVELKQFQKSITFNRNIICDTCDGTGQSPITNTFSELFDSDEIECDLCNTTGTYQKRECPSCHGEGWIKLGLSKCVKCGGSGLMQVSKTINLKQDNFKDGKLCIEYMGNYSKETDRYGNLYIVIKDDK